MAVPILLYHHIASPPPRGIPSRSNYVTPLSFARQMGLLARLGIKGLSLEQAMPYIHGERYGRIAVLTFDDGFLSVFEEALPILSYYGFSSTCFFVADRIGSINEWDHPQAHRAALMAEQHIRHFISLGHEVGSHSLTHPHLTKIDDQSAYDEIVSSKQKLETLTGKPVLSFAYPYGSENAHLRQIVQQAGYAQAVSTIKGKASQASECFALPRRSVRRGDSLPHFFVKVALR